MKHQNWRINLLEQRKATMYNRNTAPQLSNRRNWNKNKGSKGTNNKKLDDTLYVRAPPVPAWKNILDEYDDDLI